MRKLRNIILVVFMAAAMVIGFTASAMSFWPNEKVLGGTVKDIEGNILTITHVTDQGLNVYDLVFEVNEQTQLEDLASLESLQEGDHVEVKYEDQDSKKIATLITKINRDENLDQQAVLKL